MGTSVVFKTQVYIWKQLPTRHSLYLNFLAQWPQTMLPRNSITQQVVYRYNTVFILIIESLRFDYVSDYGYVEG